MIDNYFLQGNHGSGSHSTEEIKVFKMHRVSDHLHTIILSMAQCFHVVNLVHEKTNAWDHFKNLEKVKQKMLVIKIYILSMFTHIFLLIKTTVQVIPQITANFRISWRWKVMMELRRTRDEVWVGNFPSLPNLIRSSAPEAPWPHLVV